MDRQFRPLQDRLIVKRAESAAQTPGGIIIPETSKKKMTEGVVVAIGPGKTSSSGTTKPLGVKVGEHVLFDRYEGQELEGEEGSHVLLKEEHVLCVVE